MKTPIQIIPVPTDKIFIKDGYFIKNGKLKPNDNGEPTDSEGHWIRFYAICDDEIQQGDNAYDILNKKVWMGITGNLNYFVNIYWKKICLLPKQIGFVKDMSVMDYRPIKVDQLQQIFDNDGKCFCEMNTESRSFLDKFEDYSTTPKLINNKAIISLEEYKDEFLIKNKSSHELKIILTHYHEWLEKELIIENSDSEYTIENYLESIK